MNIRARVALGFTTLLLPVFNSYCATQELYTIVSPNPEANARFGGAIALSGNTAIISAPLEDVGGFSNAGSVYLFDITSGQVTHTLTCSDAPISSRNFGSVVDISNNIAVVSGYLYASAYVYDVTSGIELFKISSPSGANSFGEAAAIDGRTIIVSAPYEDYDGLYSKGAAYLFDTTFGLQTYRLINPFDDEGGGFGRSVSIHGTTALVGHATATNESGATHVFDTLTGNLKFSLTPEDTSPSLGFGEHVDIWDSIAIIGTYQSAAYLFDTNTGLQTHRLVPAGRSEFGTISTVSITGNIASVASSREAYLFDVDTGLQIGKLTPTNSSFGDPRIGISGDRAIVSRPWQSIDGMLYAGAVDVFDTSMLGSISATPSQFESIQIILQSEFDNITLSDVIQITNTGSQGSTIDIEGFMFTGANSGLFTLRDYEDKQVMAGGVDTASYDLFFTGGPIGEYTASLTLFTDTGNISYSIFATIGSGVDVVPGDTDGDGDIDDTDLGTSFANYTGPIGSIGGKTAAEGDADNDGDVDDSDLATAFAGYTGPLGPINVPEPASFALLGLGAMLVYRRRLR